MKVKPYAKHVFDKKGSGAINYNTVVCHVNVAHTEHAPLGPVFNVQQSNVTAMMKLGQQIRQIMCIILLVCKYAMNAPTGIEHKQFDTQI